MGQQQLLLVILVTIIVGIATVVAINIFGQAAEQANADAVRQDLISAATQAQAVWSRPVMMGGAGGNFTQISGTTVNELTERLNIPGNVVANVVTNENGVYTVTITDGDGISISAAPTTSPGPWTITVARTAGGNWLTTITDPGGIVSTAGGDG